MIQPPTKNELEVTFRQKHADLNGWSPRTRLRFGYFTPDEHYETIVEKLLGNGCRWLDVGGGSSPFPNNHALAKKLAARCYLAAVDPSDTVDENPFAQLRVQTNIEDFASVELFDVATLRMVAEHIENPAAAVAALARLVKPGGLVVVYTVHKWSPVSLVSWLVPFRLHHPIKRFVWGTAVKDTYPVAYKMNTRKTLSGLFQQVDFHEEYFAHLDDCRTFHRFRTLNFLELSLWKFLQAVRMRYPETCLLGIYGRSAARV